MWGRACCRCYVAHRQLRPLCLFFSLAFIRFLFDELFHSFLLSRRAFVAVFWGLCSVSYSLSFFIYFLYLLRFVVKIVNFSFSLLFRSLTHSSYLFLCFVSSSSSSTRLLIVSIHTQKKKKTIAEGKKKRKENSHAHLWKSRVDLEQIYASAPHRARHTRSCCFIEGLFPQPSNLLVLRRTRLLTRRRVNE